MTVKIEKSTASGMVSAPPSKSAAHRALICAALTDESTVKNIEYSNDILATLDCLKNLGARIHQSGNTVTLGRLDPHFCKSTLLDCRESGSTLRFIIPLCMMSNQKITLTGSERLFVRNLDIYRQIAAENGIVFEQTENLLTVCGSLKGGSYKVAGNISSQFISGLLFALPLVEGNSSVEVTGDYESEPYVALTVNVLSNFGINITRKNNVYKIAGSQTYQSKDITVEGDCSNAAFLDAFNLVGGDVTVGGLNKNSLQGDRIYKEFFNGLKSGKKQFDLSQCPDLAPVMFALSAVYGGADFTGTKRLKIKESDRAEAMKTELAKFGIKTDVFENRVTVNGGKLKTPCEMLCGHNDHRIVMALSVLCSVTGGCIGGAQAVSKSYPNFFEKIKSLGIKVLEQ